MFVDELHTTRSYSIDNLNLDMLEAIFGDVVFDMHPMKSGGWTSTLRRSERMEVVIILYFGTSDFSLS
jgi:hypothetical protein